MHTHLEQWAADIAVPREQLGIRCLALGSHLSRGHFLPDPGFEPTNVGYLGFQVHRSIGPQLPTTNLFYMHLTSPQHSTTTMISTINLNTQTYTPSYWFVYCTNCISYPLTLNLSLTQNLKKIGTKEFPHNMKNYCYFYTCGDIWSL